MKKLVAIALAFSVLNCSAVTWIFHGIRDNYLFCDIWNPTSQVEYFLQWDFDWDEANPSTPDSGIWTYNSSGESYQGPYSDVLSVVGDSFIGNSNGVVYALYSGVAGVWVKTNLISGP